MYSITVNIIWTWVSSLQPHYDFTNSKIIQFIKLKEAKLKLVFIIL